MTVPFENDTGNIVMELGTRVFTVNRFRLVPPSNHSGLMFPLEVRAVTYLAGYWTIVALWLSPWLLVTVNVMFLGT